ncbi:MAG: hypothetical protein KDA44_08650 [Planctomycetales bacterium]|nr:hypothetical protein [Planctomycetales bacterium]
MPTPALPPIDPASQPPAETLYKVVYSMQNPVPVDVAECFNLIGSAGGSVQLRQDAEGLVIVVAATRALHKRIAKYLTEARRAATQPASGQGDPQRTADSPAFPDAQPTAADATAYRQTTGDAPAAETAESDDDADGNVEICTVVYDLSDSPHVPLNEWMRILDRPGVEARWFAKNKGLVLSADRLTHKRVAWFLHESRTGQADGSEPAAGEGPFMTVLQQQAADLAYRMLGWELEPLTGDELVTVKHYGYSGGVKVVADQSLAGGLVRHDDLMLVGLHTRAIRSLADVQTLLESPDISSKSPLKYYVLGRSVPDGFDRRASGDYELLKGRVQVNEDALKARQPQSIVQPAWPSMPAQASATAAPAATPSWPSEANLQAWQIRAVLLVELARDGDDQPLGVRETSKRLRAERETLARVIKEYAAARDAAPTADDADADKKFSARLNEQLHVKPLVSSSSSIVRLELSLDRLQNSVAADAKTLREIVETYVEAASDVPGAAATDGKPRVRILEIPALPPTQPAISLYPAPIAPVQPPAYAPPQISAPQTLYPAPSTAERWDLPTSALMLVALSRPGDEDVVAPEVIKQRGAEELAILRQVIDEVAREENVDEARKPQAAQASATIVEQASERFGDKFPRPGTFFELTSDGGLDDALVQKIVKTYSQGAAARRGESPENPQPAVQLAPVRQAYAQPAADVVQPTRPVGPPASPAGATYAATSPPPMPANPIRYAPPPTASLGPYQSLAASPAPGAPTPPAAATLSPIRASSETERLQAAIAQIQQQILQSRVDEARARAAVNSQLQAKVAEAVAADRDYRMLSEQLRKVGDSLLRQEMDGTADKDNAEVIRLRRLYTELHEQIEVQEDQLQSKLRDQVEAKLIDKITVQYEPVRKILQDELARLTERLRELQSKETPAAASTAPNAPAPYVSGDPPARTLLYDGKTFEEWRDKLRFELSTERRLAAVQALAAFARAGRGREAIEAIFDVAGQYDFRVREKSPERDLKDGIVLLLAKSSDRVPERLWLPELVARLRADAGQWKWLLKQTLDELHTDDRDALALLDELADNEDLDVRLAALRALAESGFNGEKLQERLRQLVNDADAYHVRIALTIWGLPVYEVGTNSGSANRRVRTKRHRSLDILMTGLTHPDADVRRQAQFAAQNAASRWGREQGERIAEDVLRRLDDANPDNTAEQVSLVRALATLNVDSAPVIRRLVELIESDADMSVRIAATHAAMRIAVSANRGEDVEGLWHSLFDSLRADDENPNEVTKDELQRAIDAEAHVIGGANETFFGH